MHIFNHNVMKVFFATILVFSFAISNPLIAQWTDDPTQNTPIIVSNGDNVQPKFVKASDGSMFISWLGSVGGTYNVYLQRLDQNGNLLWDENGLLVANRSFTSTTDYGLTVDTEDHAVLAFRDDRFGGERISVSRISPDGNFSWGENGIQLTDGSGFVVAPNVTATSANTIVAAWTSDAGTKVSALDFNGGILWERTFTDSNPLALSDIKASDSPGETGEVIIMMQTFGSPVVPRLLRAQKVNTDGENLWGNGLIQIMTSGNLQMGNFPDFIADGNGGMIVTWYQATPSLDVYVQAINSDGTQRFPAGGLKPSTGSGLRVNPVVSFNDETNDIYVFWTELNSNQSQRGFSGQRIDSNDNRAWGNSGREFIPLSSRDMGVVTSVITDGNVLFGLPIQQTTSSNFKIKAARVDTAGEFIWENDFVDVSLKNQSYSRLGVIQNSMDESVFFWQEGASLSSNIYAQNIFSDGSLGFRPPTEGDNITFSVDMSIQSARGTFDFDAGDRVFVVGEFNDWSANAEWMLEDDDSGIYSGTFLFNGEPGTEVEYKFFVEPGEGREFPNDGFETEVGLGTNGNRVLTLTGNDQTLDPVFFNNEDEVLGQFSLLEPADQSHFDLNFQTDEVYTFSWEASALGSSYTITAEVFPDGTLAKNDEGLTFTLDAGTETSLTIAGFTLAEILLDVIFSTKADYETGMVLWTVKAEIGEYERFAEETWSFTYSIQTYVNSIPGNELPEGIKLYQNYPNPFNPATTIAFDLPESQTVQISVHDMLGRQVAVLTNGRFHAGTHHIVWDASSLSSGVYFLRMETESKIQSMKMLLLK
mgnify:CR=1 FL=1